MDIKIQRGAGLANIFMLPLLVIILSGCDFINEETTLTATTNPIYRAFEGRLTYPTGDAPYDLLTGDINKDGLQDVVTLNWTAESVSVALANANGYIEDVEYSIGPAPRMGVLADLSGNGDLSIAVINETSSKLSFLFGDGSGSFSESLTVDLPEGSGPVALTTTDLNQDGLLDLITSNEKKNDVSVIVNKGNSVFELAYSIPVGTAPAGLFSGDITGDGIPEIVVANRGDNTLSICSPSEEGYVQTALISCPEKPKQVLCKDMNMDGYMDMVVSKEYSAQITLLYGSAGGSFSEYSLSFSSPVSKFSVGDYDSNTIPDIIALLFMDDSEEIAPASLFEIMLGDASGNFRLAGIYGSGWGANAIRTADVNGDNLLDVLTADLGTDTFSVAYNRGNGSFQTERLFYVDADPGSMSVADINQDLVPDLVILGRASKQVCLLAGKGDCSFEEKPPLSLNAEPLAVAVSDLNSDGKADIVVSVNQQYDVWVFMNSGNGVFLPPRLVNVIAGTRRTPPQVMSIVLGDVNGDAKIDIVVGNTKVDTVSVLINDGTGLFGAPIMTEVDNYPLDLFLLDTNNDQKNDLVFLSRNDPDTTTDNADPRVVRWFGKGDGTFEYETHIRVATGGNPKALKMGDFSGDGRPDFATVHPGDNSLFLLRGLANGNLSVGERLPIGTAPLDAAFADIKKDKKNDMVVTTSMGSLFLRFSRGDASFEGINNFVVYQGISRILIHDLNGDSFVDAVMVDKNRGALRVMRGRSIN